MIKKYLNVLMLCLLFITGCGSAKLKNEKNLIKYLKSYYPDEQFEILSNNNIDIYGCNRKKRGHSYRVKSLNTSLEFIVEDSYDYNSFVCEYGINDKYIEVAKKNFLNKNIESKMEYYTNCDLYGCVGISFSRHNYYSDDEMVNDIWNVVTQLKNTYPFKYTFNDKNSHIYIDISIKEIDDATKIFDVRDLYSKDLIYSLVK